MEWGGRERKSGEGWGLNGYGVGVGGGRWSEGTTDISTPPFIHTGKVNVKGTALKNCSCEGCVTGMNEKSGKNRF